MAGEGLVVDELRKTMLASGVNPLSLPAEYRLVEAIPKLGSGKTDFTAARTLATAQREA